MDGHWGPVIMNVLLGRPGEQLRIISTGRVFLFFSCLFERPGHAHFDDTNVQFFLITFIPIWLLVGLSYSFFLQVSWGAEFMALNFGSFVSKIAFRFGLAGDWLVRNRLISLSRLVSSHP